MAATGAGLIVHHLNNSRSQRILWLLEELDVPYTIKGYQRNPKTMRAPKELAEVHPLGKSPVITDSGVTIAETGRIVEYIMDKYGKGRLQPKAGTDDHLRYRFWLHHAEGSAMLPLLLSLVFTKVATDSPFFIRPLAGLISSSVHSSFITPEIDKEKSFVNGELTKSEFFAGDQFTAADVIMSFPLELMATGRGSGGIDDAPKIKPWLDKVHARPAYKRALDKAGMEYAYL